MLPTNDKTLCEPHKIITLFIFSGAVVTHAHKKNPEIFVSCGFYSLAQAFSHIFGRYWRFLCRLGLCGFFPDSKNALAKDQVAYWLQYILFLFVFIKIFNYRLIIEIRKKVNFFWFDSNTMIRKINDVLLLSITTII